MASEPPPCQWEFPDPHLAPALGLVASGGDLEPGTVLAAYRRGLFPMPGEVAGEINWWSPDPRGVLDPRRFHASRSLGRARRRFTVTVNERFDAVVAGCADPSRPGAWITDDIAVAYRRLHDLGWAHSVEVLDATGGLVGGVYGVAIGGFFAGESMFHRATDASKVALWALCGVLADAGATLFDVQWTTDHLCSLGACDVPRAEYLDRLATALVLPVDPFSGR